MPTVRRDLKQSSRGNRKPHGTAIRARSPTRADAQGADYLGAGCRRRAIDFPPGLGDQQVHGRGWQSGVSGLALRGPGREDRSATS